MMEIWAIVILAFSATFTAYLAEYYTTSFQIATFAKSTSMVLFFAGIIMLFVAVGWWGFAGIVGWWLLLTVERVSWRKMLRRHLEAGINPYISSLEASKKAVEELKRYDAERLGMEHREEQRKMNWFQRHLNWTLVFAYLIWIPLNATAGEGLPVSVLYPVGNVFLLIVSGWVIKQKGRRLWWVFLTPLFSPLWLKNMSLVSQSLPTIKDEERQECLAYYEEEKRLQLLSTRVYYFFNKRLDKYEDAYFKARKTHREFWSSMEKIFEVNEYISQAATEIINRKSEMIAAPSAASKMSSAWESLYLDYKALKDPRNIAAGDPMHVAVANARQKEIVKKMNESFRQAREEEKRLLKRLKLSSGEYQRIVDNAAKAVATDKWLRKLEAECP